MFRQRTIILISIIAAVVLILAAVSLSALTASIAVTSSLDSFLPFVIGGPKPTVAMLPDLTVTYTAITLEDPTCYAGESLGLRAYIANIGVGHAGAFVVEINGVAATVDGLDGGASTSVWLPGYTIEPTVVVDATDMVVESNENNNVFHELVPVPTAPPPCS